MRNGITPTHAEPWQVSTSNPSGKCCRTRSGSTGQCAKSSSDHFMRITQGAPGRAQVRSVAVTACFTFHSVRHEPTFGRPNESLEGTCGNCPWLSSPAPPLHFHNLDRPKPAHTACNSSLPKARITCQSRQALVPDLNQSRNERRQQLAGRKEGSQPRLGHANRATCRHQGIGSAWSRASRKSLATAA